MASKTKKSSTPMQSSSTPVPVSGTPTPMMSSRPGSPLSPTRHSRLHEKAELQNLNDRLAAYIDRVRNLETENSRLTMEVHTSRETVTREVSNIKSMYEHELSDARKLLDETAREKAKLEIDIKRLWEENDDLKQRLEKKSKEFTVADNSARMYEARCGDINAKYNSACSERKLALDENKELEKELAKLRRQLAELRKAIEDETLTRIDLENNVQSLREELTFKEQVFQQELSETRTSRQVDITEIDGRLAEQYEEKLKLSLQELRDQYEMQMRANREEIEILYDSKIKNLQAAAHRNSNATGAAVDELRQTRMRIESLNSRIGELESSNSGLHARNRDLENMLEQERSRHQKEMELIELELSRLRDEMAHQLQEYQDLMDIKVSLDMEIAAYDKLLKGEEFRLNLTPTNSASVSSLSQSLRSGRGTPVRRTPSRAATAFGTGSKRKRTTLEESEERSLADYSVTSSAKGDIEIREADPNGKFVKLHNKSNKEIAVGGWQLVRTAGANETTFKFHRSVKVDANATICVWSSDAGMQHEPPSNIVMKQQKWFIGDNMKTLLINGEGEEVAGSERLRHQISSHASRHRETSLFGGGEEFYHQQGDPQGTEKCRLM